MDRFRGMGQRANADDESPDRRGPLPSFPRGAGIDEDPGLRCKLGSTRPHLPGCLERNAGSRPQQTTPHIPGRNVAEKIRDVVSTMNIQTRLLSLEEQKAVDEIRRLLGPEESATIQEKQRKRKTS